MFGLRAPFSCFGPKIALVDAGDAIYTTDRVGSAGASDDDYLLSSGTSFASQESLRFSFPATRS